MINGLNISYKNIGRGLELTGNGLHLTGSTIKGKGYNIKCN